MLHCVAPVWQAANPCNQQPLHTSHRHSLLDLLAQVNLLGGLEGVSGRITIMEQRSMKQPTAGWDYCFSSWFLTFSPCFLHYGTCDTTYSRLHQSHIERWLWILVSDSSLRCFNIQRLSCITAVWQNLGRVKFLRVHIQLEQNSEILRTEIIGVMAVKLSGCTVLYWQGLQTHNMKTLFNI